MGCPKCQGSGVAEKHCDFYEYGDGKTCKAYSWMGECNHCSGIGKVDSKEDIMKAFEVAVEKAKDEGRKIPATEEGFSEIRGVMSRVLVADYHDIMIKHENRAFRHICINVSSPGYRSDVYFREVQI